MKRVRDHLYFVTYQSYVNPANKVCTVKHIFKKREKKKIQMLRIVYLACNIWYPNSRVIKIALTATAKLLQVD